MATHGEIRWPPAGSHDKAPLDVFELGGAGRLRLRCAAALGGAGPLVSDRRSVRLSIPSRALAVGISPQEASANAIRQWCFRARRACSPAVVQLTVSGRCSAQEPVRRSDEVRPFRTLQVHRATAPSCSSGGQAGCLRTLGPDCRRCSSAAAGLGTTPSTAKPWRRRSRTRRAAGHRLAVAHPKIGTDRLKHRCSSRWPWSGEPSRARRRAVSLGSTGRGDRQGRSGRAARRRRASASGVARHRRGRRTVIG